jgi:hypothetical protein
MAEDKPRKRAEPGCTSQTNQTSNKSIHRRRESRDDIQTHPGTGVVASPSVKSQMAHRRLCGRRREGSRQTELGQVPPQGPGGRAGHAS